MLLVQYVHRSGFPSGKRADRIRLTPRGGYIQIYTMRTTPGHVRRLRLAARNLTSRGRHRRRAHTSVPGSVTLRIIYRMRYIRYLIRTI